MTISSVSRGMHRPLGAWKTPANYVGGKHFGSFDDFKNALIDGGGQLAPGASVKINIGAFGPGGNLPSLHGLNSKSPFTQTVKNGVMTLKAKKTAKMGQKDVVSFQPASLPGQKVKSTRFTLQVGLSRIHIG
jgi:hypothetical protein